MAEGAIKLNLGAGHRHLKGFINCDLDGNWSKVQPDVVCDVTKPLPFEHNYADEVHAYHLFEHIQRWEAPEVLRDWIRVLKPGGLLVLELPCFDKIVRHLAVSVIDGAAFDPRLTMWGLYGDPRYKNEAMVHKWCYSVAELAGMLQNAGLVEIEPEEPQTHQPARDMRMTARKPHGSDVQ